VPAAPSVPESAVQWLTSTQVPPRQTTSWQGDPVWGQSFEVVQVLPADPPLPPEAPLVPPVEAPPVEAPPVEAPPVEVPPVEAPPVETPPVEAPPTPPFPPAPAPAPPESAPPPESGAPPVLGPKPTSSWLSEQPKTARTKQKIG
jgi:hypothetical protein